MKVAFSILVTAMMTAPAMAQTLTITDASGWFESAYVKWQCTEDVNRFNVTYSGEGLTDQKIDDQLIRNYGDFYRADILGLKAGTYTLKIAPVIAGQEGPAVDSNAVTVESYDRSGFAFWTDPSTDVNAPWDRWPPDPNADVNALRNEWTPGAYNHDGTPKDNAVILYITQNTKDTIQLDVTGAKENPCVGLQAILDGFKKGKDTRPLIIRLVGQITDPAYLQKGDLVIENHNNPSSMITLEGVGDDATVDGWGIRLKHASNVEIRNIGIMNCNSNEGDSIGLQQDNDHIWVHHCDFFYGEPGSDADQIKGDGALDCKKSTYVTISYNHFWDTGKTHLLGLSEGTTSGLFVTYHHNWYDHSDSRHPRVRYYSAHVYNNYYDGNSKYGVGVTDGSSVLVEANYFRNCRYPMLTSMQGSDVYDESTGHNDYSDMPTFSKEDGGSIKAFNNVMTGQRRFVAYGDPHYPNSTVDFDAYVTGTRDEKVPSNVKSSHGGNTYNNFDTNPDLMVQYPVDSPTEARDKVILYAGRINGGDFQWTFDNPLDDTSYDVNEALRDALNHYQTSLVSIQGDGPGNSEGNGDGGRDNSGNSGSGSGQVITGDIVHNFTVSGKTSDFFSISGNLSDSKGTVHYAGLTLTQCLKIETVTLISFTTTEASILTLVFNEYFNDAIKIDGTSHDATAGVLTITLPAGVHDITKDNVANLYLISLSTT